MVQRDGFRLQTCLFNKTRISTTLSSQEHKTEHKLRALLQDFKWGSRQGRRYCSIEIVPRKISVRKKKRKEKKHKERLLEFQVSETLETEIVI